MLGPSLVRLHPAFWQDLSTYCSLVLVRMPKSASKGRFRKRLLKSVI